MVSVRNMSSVKDRISMFEKTGEREQIEIKRKSDHPVQTNRAILQKCIDTVIEKSPEQRAVLLPTPFDITGDFVPRQERSATPPAQWTPPSKREMKSPPQQPLNKKIVFSPKLNPIELSSKDAAMDEANVVKEEVMIELPVPEAKPKEVKIEAPVPEAKPKEVKIEAPAPEANPKEVMIEAPAPEAKSKEVKDEAPVAVREEAKPIEVRTEAPAPVREEVEIEESVPVKEQVTDVVMEVPVCVVEEIKVDEPVAVRDESNMEEVNVETVEAELVAIDESEPVQEEMNLEEVKPEPMREESKAGEEATITVPVSKPRVVLNGESTHVVGQVGDSVVPVATFEETDEPMTPKQAMDSVIVTLNAEVPVESVLVVTAPMPEQVMETVKELNASSDIDHSTVLDKPLFPKPPLFTE